MSGINPVDIKRFDLFQGFFQGKQGSASFDANGDHRQIVLPEGVRR